jgi:hypothetical protein
MPTTTAPPRPVAIDRVLDDPGLIRRLIRDNSPYTHVLMLPEFGGTASESGCGMPAGYERFCQRIGDEYFINPVFRGNWAYDRPLVDHVEPLLYNERFVDAAKAVLGGTVVRPQIVYANLTAPMGRNQKHTDVPAFRGVDRTAYPAWVVNAMQASGLFDRWRVRLATAVAWYYEGAEGGFSYWPDGPDGDEVTIDPPSNTAVVGDNDVMFHRVEAVGTEQDGSVVPIDSLLRYDAAAEEWDIAKGERTFGRFAWDDIRVSVSWKAQVFADAAEARVFDEHLDDVSFESVVGAWRTDLADRGVGLPDSGDPLHDPAFVSAVTSAYAGTVR